MLQCTSVSRHRPRTLWKRLCNVHKQGGRVLGGEIHGITHRVVTVLPQIPLSLPNPPDHRRALRKPAPKVALSQLLAQLPSPNPVSIPVAPSAAHQRHFAHGSDANGGFYGSNPCMFCGSVVVVFVVNVVLAAHLALTGAALLSAVTSVFVAFFRLSG